VSGFGGSAEVFATFFVERAIGCEDGRVCANAIAIVMRVVLWSGGECAMGISRTLLMYMRGDVNVQAHWLFQVGISLPGRLRQNPGKLADGLLHVLK